MSDISFSTVEIDPVARGMTTEDLNQVFLLLAQATALREANQNELAAYWAASLNAHQASLLQKFNNTVLRYQQEMTLCASIDEEISNAKVH